MVHSVQLAQQLCSVSQSRRARFVAVDTGALQQAQSNQSN